MIVREYEKDEITVHKVPLFLMGGIVVISLALTASVQLGFFERSAVVAEARAEAKKQKAEPKPDSSNQQLAQAHYLKP